MQKPQTCNKSNIFYFITISIQTDAIKVGRKKIKLLKGHVPYQGEGGRPPSSQFKLIPPPLSEWGGGCQGMSPNKSIFLYVYCIWYKI